MRDRHPILGRFARQPEPGTASSTVDYTVGGITNDTPFAIEPVVAPPTPSIREVLWKCPNGHILGLIRRERVTVNRKQALLPRLVLFRSARRSEDVYDGCDILAIIDAGKSVECDICHAHRDWQPGDDFIALLRSS